MFLTEKHDGVFLDAEEMRDFFSSHQTGADHVEPARGIHSAQPVLVHGAQLRAIS